MAEHSKFLLSAAVNQLIDWYANTQHQRKRIDHILIDGNQLLVAWPNTKEKTSSGNPSCDKESTPASAQNQATGNVVSIKEQQEADLVRKALAKAERTRNVLAKRLEKEDRDAIPCEKEAPPNKMQSKETRKNTVQMESVKTIEPTPAQNKIPSRYQRANFPSRGNACTTSATISQSKLDSLIKPPSATRGRKGTSYVSAHSKAPFKTDAITKKLPARKVISRTGSRPNSKTNVIRVQSVSPATGIGRNDFTQTAVRGGSQERRETPMVCEPEVADVTEKVNSWKICSQPDSVEDCQPEHSKINQPTEENKQIEAENSKFMLARDGKKLTIPTKLAKLVANNRRLREKVKKEAISVRVTDTASSPDRFMNKFCDAIKSNFSSEECNIVSELCKFSSVYENLNHWLESTISKEWTAFSSFEDIARARKTLELILCTFSSMEGEFRQLMRVSKPFLIKEAACPEMQRYGTTRHSSYWWLPLKDKSPAVLFGGISPKLKYRRKSALMRFYDLVHQYQILLLEKQLVDDVAPKLLTALAEMDPDNSEYVQLHRHVYTLVCGRGRFFPTVVEDDSDEGDSDDVNDF